MLKIALCDDDSIFLESFCHIVEKAFREQDKEFEIKCFSSGKEFLNENTKLPFDVLFLDIDMPDFDGFDVAKELKNINEDCYTVFVTGHSELVYDSFYFHPTNFITKDTSEIFVKRVNAVVNQIVNDMNQDKLIVLDSRECGRRTICLRDVVYIESDKHNVIFHVVKNDEKIAVRESITAVSEKYKDCDFIRVHKKYLVNLRFVFNLDRSSETVIFNSKFILPMSRNYRAEAEEKFTEYMRKTK